MRSDSEKLYDFRKSLHLTQQEFVNKIGMTLSAVSMVECGKRKLSFPIKVRIKDIFNYDIDKEEYIEQLPNITYSNIIPIPFYHIKAAANPSGGVIVMDFPESECLWFDKRWLKNVLGVNPYNCSIIEAKGDSMDSGLNKSDDIKEGDLLLVDNSDVEIINNKTYIITLLDTNELLVKKIKKEFNGEVLLISNNNKYSTRTLTSSDMYQINGRVVWNGSREKI